MTLLLQILWPTVLAGVVAVGVTLAVERWGGVVGGLLGTLPTTIVPASWGIWAASADPTVFATAMAAVPVGMLVDVLFLYLWRVVPPRLGSGTLRAQLATMVGVSLLAWAGLAAAAVGALHGLTASGIPAVAIGSAALATNLTVGVWACRARVPAPRGTRRVPMAVLVGRGGLAGLAVAGSTWLAHAGDGALAGIASVFPAIFLTTMVGLWLSQGRAVPAGAVGPMMLGASSVGAFALGAALAVPGLGLAAGMLVAWLLAAGMVTVPALIWLRSRPA